MHKKSSTYPRRKSGNPSKVPTRTHSESANHGQVRIIGGEWRGRKLPVLMSEGLRPTSDRVRETAFNWLQFDVPDARCLDLFAGSGALGLEALSRGASFVQFVEFTPKVVKQLSENLQTLKASERCASLVQADAFAFLDRPAEKPFDIVFLDPPFYKDFLPNILQKLFANGHIANSTKVYIEQEKQQPWPDLPAGWHWIREKSTSQVRYGLLSYGR